MLYLAYRCTLVTLLSAASSTVPCRTVSSHPVVQSLVAARYSDIGGPTARPREVVDTTTTADSTLVLLTPDLLTRYLALEHGLREFWKTHQTLEDTAKAHTHAYPFFMGPPLNMAVPMKVYDYDTLAAQEPALANIFQQNHITPQQYKGLYLSAVAADYDAEMARERGKVSDTTTVKGKNAALARAHLSDLAAVGIDFQIHMSGPK